MGALDAVEWEPCLLEPVQNRDAERLLRKEVGIVSPGARYFLDSEWLTRAGAALDGGNLPTLHVSNELMGMIALAVSQENACRYCYEATRLVLRILGYPDGRIRRLEEEILGNDLPRTDVLALQFARCVSRAAPLATCEDGRPLLEAGYAVDAVKEIAVLATVHVFFNRLATAPALPPTDWHFDQRWYMRLLRPLLARIIRPARARGRTYLRPEQREGPFAEIVNALDGLPAAPRIRTVIDAAWASPLLPNATKAMVFAVIGRGIGCTTAEREAVRLLQDEGLDAGTIEAALAHLGFGRDERERAAVSLARETIWYRPAPLQRHARAIRGLFSRAEFVELLGVTALANMVCRLAVAAELGGPSR